MENNYYNQHDYNSYYNAQQSSHYNHSQCSDHHTQQFQHQPHSHQQQKENFSWCRKRQFHNSLKMMMQQQQQNLETTSVNSSPTTRPPVASLGPNSNIVGAAKSTTGNLLGLNTNPMGVADNPNYSSAASSLASSPSTQNRTTPSATTVVDIIPNNTGWNNASAEHHQEANFHHYNDDLSTNEDMHHKREQNDEELTSMLQRYLDNSCSAINPSIGDHQLDFAYHQKSPGQQSSDSGFDSGDQNQKFNQNSNMDFDLNDYDGNGEDLSQLVDQVLSSIDAQFPDQESYMQYVDHPNVISNGQDVIVPQQKKEVTFEDRPKPACVAVARPMPQNGGQISSGTGNGNRNLSLPLAPSSVQHQNQHQQTPIMMTQQNYAEQLSSRVVMQQSQNRNCNDILAAKPQSNKKRTIGVVEPRVVVKIPLAKVARDNNNTNSNITGSPSDFLPSANLSSLSSESQTIHNSNTSTTLSRKRQNNDHQSNTVDESSEEEDGEETSLNMSVMELHRHQEIVDNTLEDSNSSDSDTTTTITASLKKRARILVDEQSSTVEDSINPLKLIRRLVPGTNQETYTVHEKQQILQKNEGEPERSSDKEEIKKQNSPQTTTPPFVVYNYMDNLPTFSDLTQSKQEHVDKKEKEIKETPIPSKVSISPAKEKKSEQFSNNLLEQKGKQELNVSVTKSKQESSSNIVVKSKEELIDSVTESKQKLIDSVTESKQKNNKLDNKQVKVTIERETDGKWMYCTIKGCHFWTRKQVRMERHEKSHIPGDDKFYQCPECQLKICSLSKLLRHDRKFHTGFKDYECKICEAEVTDIAVHMRVHRTEKQFTCHVCKLQFRHKNSLVRHLFQHSGERPFRCQSCESGFTSINRLKEHIKKKHPDTPAAQSIIESAPTTFIGAPAIAPKNTLTPTATGSTTIPTLASKFTPIAPAPAKVSWTSPHQITTQQPTQILFQQPNSSLPILTQGPNGTMLLVSPNTFAFPAQPQFILPTAQFQQQPLLYGIQPTFLQPQVQTTFITQQQLTNSQHQLSHLAQNSNEEITILSQQSQQGVKIQTSTTPQQAVILQNGQQMQIAKTESVKKFDILERAILEIANLDEETKHQ